MPKFWTHERTLESQALPLRPTFLYLIQLVMDRAIYCVCKAMCVGIEEVKAEVFKINPVY